MAHKEELRAQEQEAAKIEKVAAAPVAAPKPKKKGLSWAEQKELDGMLDRIDAAETEVKRLEGELADPSLYSARAAEVPALTQKLEAARADAAKLIARWEELEAKKEA